MERTDLQRAMHGDAQAFERLVAPMSEQLFALCRALCRHEQDAQDAYVEALTRLYEKLHAFKGESSLTTFAYTLTRNACLDLLRQRKRRAAESLDSLLEMGADVRDDHAETPETALLRRERERALNAALDSLSPEGREAVVLRDVQGLPYADVAALCRQPLGTVKSRLSRAREHIVKFLRNDRRYAELFHLDERPKE